MIRRPPRSTQGVSSAASDVYKRQPKDYLKKYIFEKYTTKVASNKNKSYMVAFLNELSQNKKQKEAPVEEDLFGNVISNPCRGSDGGIYDLESMNYLFEKKPDGDYKNIPYTYNEQNQRVPSFPRMSNGDRLTSFCLLYTSPSPRDLSTSRMPSSA